MKTLIQILVNLTTMARRLGPYVLIELLLPGGTLFALALFLYRHPQHVREYAGTVQRSVAKAWASARDAVVKRAARAPALSTGIVTAVGALG